MINKLKKNYGLLKGMFPAVGARLTNAAKAMNEVVKERLGLWSSAGEEGLTAKVTLEVEKVMRWMLETQKSKGVVIPEKTRWKFSLDAREVGGQQQVMVGVTPMDLDLPVNSCFSVLPLALYVGDESNEGFHDQVAPLAEEMEALEDNGIIFSHNCSTRPEFVMSADLKSCWAIYGFGGVFAQEQCPYCSIQRKERHRYGACTSITRTLADFPKAVVSIPPQKFLFCSLHMLLRVVDYLWLKLVTVIRANSRTRKRNLKKLEEILVRHGLKFKYYEFEDANGNKQWEVGSFTGKQCRKLLEYAATEICSLDSSEDGRSGLTYDCWSKFWTLWKRLNDTEDHVGFHVAAQDWGRCMFDRYGERSFRIYVHLLIDHGEDLMKRFGALGIYSNQAFENEHKRERIIYYRRTSHDGGKVGHNRMLAMEQILNIVYRQNFAKFSPVEYEEIVE